MHGAYSLGARLARFEKRPMGRPCRQLVAGRVPTRGKHMMCECYIELIPCFQKSVTQCIEIIQDEDVESGKLDLTQPLHRNLGPVGWMGR
jgi:hypothetical protein